MEKSSLLNLILVEDRLIRLNIQILEGMLREIKADVEELTLLAEDLLSEDELKLYRNTVLKIEADLLAKISESLDHIYDIYEVFNFDVTFNSINSKLELIGALLDEVLLVAEQSHRLFTLLAPFRVYREAIKQNIEFNRKLKELTHQKTG